MVRPYSHVYRQAELKPPLLLGHLTSLQSGQHSHQVTDIIYSTSRLNSLTLLLQPFELADLGYTH